MAHISHTLPSPPPFFIPTICVHSAAVSEPNHPPAADHQSDHQYRSCSERKKPSDFFFFCLSVCLSSEVVQTLFRGCECGHPDRYVAIGCTSQTWLQCLLEGRHAKGKMEKYIKITEKKKGLPDVWSERMPQQARQLEKAYGILSSMSF